MNDPMELEDALKDPQAFVEGMEETRGESKILPPFQVTSLRTAHWPIEPLSVDEAIAELEGRQSQRESEE